MAQSADVSAQRRVVQEKYETSISLCYQKFAVSDCKNDATRALNAELTQLKKGEAEKMQISRAQSAQEKVGSLSARRFLSGDSSVGIRRLRSRPRVFRRMRAKNGGAFLRSTRRGISRHPHSYLTLASIRAN